MITDTMGADVESGDVQPRNTETQSGLQSIAEVQQGNAHDVTHEVIQRAKMRSAERQTTVAEQTTSDGASETDEAEEGARPSGSPVWFGPTDRPLRGWIHRPLGGSPSNSRRVVIVPGFGYEELTAGWGLRALAEELACNGHTVLRYDHPGTGDSSGDGATVSEWFDGIHHAVSALNFPDVTLIGVRLGATLALTAAAEFSSRQSHQTKQTNLHTSSEQQGTELQSVRPGEVVAGKAFANGAITQIIAVSPIVSGRRMMRELTMLAATKKAVAAEPIGEFEAGPLQLSWAAPTTASRSTSSSSGPQSSPLTVGGFTYSSELRTGLGMLDLLGLPASPAPRVEIVHTNERATDKNFIEHLRGLGTAVYESHVEGIATWLDTSSELAAAPQPLISLLRDQLYGDSMVDAVEVRDQSKRFTNAVTLSVDEKLVRERCFILGEPSLSAVLTEPTETPGVDEVAVLLLNSGVERSIGPGRAWVQWSRTLGAAGSTVLRLDLSGVGNSGTWPGKPAFHNYGPETFDDVALGIASLRSMGHQKIVIVGLCASAYSALGTAVQPGVVGIVSLSPQFYRCGTPGSMAEVEDTNFNRHRISQLDQKLHLRRKGAAIEELVGKRHQSVTWIDAWMAQGTHVRLVFGPDDRGLRFLQWRTPRSLKRLAKTPTFALQVHPNLDHALHEATARADVFTDLRAFIKGL
jgi:pimeloyl-ACP methyl ester carboxylesterase